MPRPWNGNGKRRRAPSRAGARGSYIERMSDEPHLAGTPQSKAVADYLVGICTSGAWTRASKSSKRCCPRPIRAVLEMMEPKIFRAKLEEPRRG